MSGKSNHFDSITAIAAIIKAANLPELQRDPVVQEILDYKAPALVTPCVLLAPYGEETVDDDVNAEDEIGYPTAIVFICDNTNNAINLETRLGWRQTVRRRLNNVSIPGMPTGNKFSVRCATIVQQAAWKQQLWVSGLVVTAWFQEPRQ